MWLARARVQLPRPAVRAILGLSAAALVLVVARWLRPVRPIDLSVYLSGARALLHGADVTSAHPADSLLPFTYPPFAALLFVPLLALPTLRAASMVMTALSVTALLVATRISLEAVRPAWSARRCWLVAVPVAAAAVPLDPLLDTVQLGQVNLILLAILLTDLLAPPDRRFRGALVGLATGIKLTPAIFIVFLLVTGQWRAARTAVATGLGTVAVGLLLAPASTVKFWTVLIFDPGHVGGIPYAGNQSLYGLTTRIGHGEHALRWVWVIAVVAASVLGLTAARWAHQAGHRLAAVSLVGLTGLLDSPVSWNHHWVWLVPGVLALWSARWWLPTGLVVLSAAAPIWWVPRGGNREYDEHGWQLLAGNAYVLAGVLTLVLAAAYLTAQRRRTDLAVPRIPERVSGPGGSVEGGSVEGGEQGLGQVRGQVVADQQFVLRLVRPAETDGGGA